MYTIEITHIYDHNFKPSKYVNRSLVQTPYGDRILDKRFVYFVYHLYSISSFLDKLKIRLCPDYTKSHQGENIKFFKEEYYKYISKKDDSFMDTFNIINHFVNPFSPMLSTYYISFRDLNTLEENLKFFRNIYPIDDNIYSINHDPCELDYQLVDGVLINHRIELRHSKFRKPKNINTRKQLKNRIHRLYEKKNVHLFYETLLDWYCHTILNLTNLQIPIVEKRMFEII